MVPLLLGELVAEFTRVWCVLSDPDQFENLPDLAATDPRVVASLSAVAFPVMHGQSGEETAVRVHLGPAYFTGRIVFEGTIHTSNGRLRLSDMLGEHSRMFAVAPGVHRVRIFVDELPEPGCVDIELH